MPQNSRYTNAEFETLMNKVILTLEENDAGRDLSLLVLGNVITHILQTQVSPDTVSYTHLTLPTIYSV